MVKKIEEKVKELVEGKKQNIILEFNTGAQHEHHDIAGYSVNGDWVAVMDKQGATNIYPARNIAFVKHYTAE